jgi:hypothetical protein
VNKDTSEIISVIENYFRDIADKNISTVEMELNITKSLISHGLVTDEFLVEVVTLNDSYLLRSRTYYTREILGALIRFCNECGRRAGKDPCTHGQSQ